MKRMENTVFKELSSTDLYEVCAGGDFSFGDWVIDYFAMVGEALHDWFGCVKCGLHWF